MANWGGAPGGLLAGRYRVLRELGSGSMGVVWEAHDEVLDRLVALKELRPPVGLDRDAAVERFLTEARAAARLKHPNIVTVHDVVSDGDRVLMALECLEGPTFAELALPVDPVTARSLLGQVAGALAEAHVNGVVHRDLKPENVFALADGRAVVCDFGLARIGAGTGTQAGTVMGTPGYLAPEQVRGEPVGPAADVFAWGSLGYELLSGLPAFGSPELDVATLLYNVVHVDPAPLTAVGDPELVALIGQSLSKDPAGRPSSGVELVQALAGGVPVSGWVPMATSGPAAVPSQRPRKPGGAIPWVIGGAVALMLVLVGALVLMTATKGENEVVTGNTLGDVVDIPEVTTEISGVTAEIPEPTSPTTTPPSYDEEVLTNVACPSVVAQSIRTALPGSDPGYLQARYEAGNFIIHICAGLSGPIYHGQHLETGNTIALPATGDVIAGFEARNGTVLYAIDDRSLVLWENGVLIQEDVVFAHEEY